MFAKSLLVFGNMVALGSALPFLRKGFPQSLGGDGTDCRRAWQAWLAASYILSMNSFSPFLPRSNSGSLHGVSQAGVLGFCIMARLGKVEVIGC